MSLQGGVTDEATCVLLVAGRREGELRDLLQLAGVEVVSGEQGAHSIDGDAGRRPDLLLLALDDMGEAVTWLERARQAPALDSTPVIALVHEAADRLALISAGADDALDPALASELVGNVLARVNRARLMRVTEASAGNVVERRRGRLRRGEFLAQLSTALASRSGDWQVLIALRLDQGKDLAESLGQSGAYALEQMIADRFAPVLGGDDAYTLWMEFGFGVLAERDDREQVVELCQALCRCVAQAPFELGGKSLALTLSVGVALTPGAADSADPDRWFASAYAAQAIAHRLGGNRYDGVLSREHGAMPPERVLIIREWVKEAVAGDNVLIEFQPVLPLQDGLAGLYSLDARLRDYRAPLAGVRRREYLGLARDAGALPMIDRMSLFSAFEAIEQERGRGFATRILVPVDLVTVNDAQLVWLDAELRRRRAHSDGLIIEFDADMALGRPELARVVQRMEDQGVVIAISDNSGDLARMPRLQRFPAALLRLPVTAIDSVTPEEFATVIAPWRDSGRGVIADGATSIEAVARLYEMKVSYVQGDALAAGGPRLDYEFNQFGL